MKTVSIQITEINEVGKREMTNEELGQFIQIALDTVNRQFPKTDPGYLTKFKVHEERLEIIMTQEDFDKEGEKEEQTEEALIKLPLDIIARIHHVASKGNMTLAIQLIQEISCYFKTRKGN